jgi:hypothetical protein
MLLPSLDEKVSQAKRIARVAVAVAWGQFGNPGKGMTNILE